MKTHIFNGTMLLVLMQNFSHCLTLHGEWNHVKFHFFFSVVHFVVGKFQRWAVWNKLRSVPIQWFLFFCHCEHLMLSLESKSISPPIRRFNVYCMKMPNTPNKAKFHIYEKRKMKKKQKNNTNAISFWNVPQNVQVKAISGRHVSGRRYNFVHCSKYLLHYP